MSETRPTKNDVLLAVREAVAPYSNYIADWLRRKGKDGNVTTATILRRLRALADDGLLTRSRFTTGYYGYSWTITDAGKQTLPNPPHLDRGTADT